MLKAKGTPYKLFDLEYCVYVEIVEIGNSTSPSGSISAANGPGDTPSGILLSFGNGTSGSHILALCPSRDSEPSTICSDVGARGDRPVLSRAKIP